MGEMRYSNGLTSFVVTEEVATIRSDSCSPENHMRRVELPSVSALCATPAGSGSHVELNSSSRWFQSLRGVSRRMCGSRKTGFPYV